MTMTLFLLDCNSNALQILGIHCHMASTFNPLGALSSPGPNLHKTKITATQKVKVIRTKLRLYLLLLRPLWTPRCWAKLLLVSTLPAQAQGWLSYPLHCFAMQWGPPGCLMVLTCSGVDLQSRDTSLRWWLDVVCLLHEEDQQGFDSKILFVL